MKVLQTQPPVHCRGPGVLVGEGAVLLVGEGAVLLVGEGDVLLVGEGDVLLVGEGDVLLVGEGDVLSIPVLMSVGEVKGTVMPSGTCMMASSVENLP